jgi:Bifunctional DNA primase/polymerase, N-terminal
VSTAPQLELLNEALAHLRRGWALLPVDAGTKRPASKLIRRTRGHNGWAPLRHKPAGEDEVRDWLEHDPNAGAGVITGQPSQLAVVDVDDETLAPDLPVSATVFTRRGRHVYYRCDQPTRSRDFDWGELKADGRYVVAPTSRVLEHTYRWTRTPEEIGELANSASVAALEPSIGSTCRQTLRDRVLSESVVFKGLRTTCPQAKKGRLRLADLERSEPLALRLAAALGVPKGVRLGEPFRCLIHPDRRPSASLWRREPEAHVLYGDWHAGRHGEQRWLPLATVRARLAGRQGPLAAPELVVWKLRLASEAELVEPVAFELDTDRPPQSLEAAWDGFLELLGLRWTIEPGLPAPFSARFTAAWCGLSKREAHEAVAELARQGFLRLEGRDAHGCRLWLPKGVRPST